MEISLKYLFCTDQRLNLHVRTLQFVLYTAKKSLKELRQLYYRLKDDVFASPRFGISYNTEALEKLLIDVFGTEMTLEHDRENIPKYIRVLVTV